jgi:DNA-binding transcriptional ArsR family regulator
MAPADVDPAAEPTVVSFEDADAMIEALASTTARAIVAALDAEPMAPAALADRVDTSLQNTLYHLDRLTEAGLLEVVDTGYSARGNEMDVYAPAADPVVICVGDGDSERAVAEVVTDSRSAAGPAGSD